MIRVNKVGDSLTGSVNGKQFGIAFEQNKYDSLLDLQRKADAAQTVAELNTLYEAATKLTSPDFQEIVDTATDFLKVNRETGAYYLKLGNQVSKLPLPKALVKRVQDALAMSIDVDPIVKAWKNFLRNPNASAAKAEKFAWYINQTYTNTELAKELMGKGLSDEAAKERATTFQVPITMEGLLCTYKVSREITRKFVKDTEAEGGVKEVDRYDYEVDEITGLKTYKQSEHVEDRIFEPAVQGKNGDAFKCINILTAQETEGHIIRVGHIHELDSWEKVNCNDSRSGVPGLHVGNLDYIRGYQNNGTETHNVFVDPMDIGAVVQDNSGAIRCRRYMVHSSFAGVNRSLYHSSRFAKITDDEFKAQLAKVIEESRAKFEADTAGWNSLI